jgi:tetratricopeptide (TPR) repeat protein
MMKSKNILKIFFLFGLCLCLIVSLYSQQGHGRGRIHGEVRDEAGQPIGGAKIVAEYLGAGTTFESNSDENGNWAIAGLGTGYFRITVTKDGYGTVYHEMNVSQFSQQNPPLSFSLRKIRTSSADIPALQDETTIAIFEEGNELYEQKKYAEAAAKFEEFMAKNPTIYQANINIGNSYREMGEYDKALAAYNKILEKVKEEKGSYQGDETAAKALANIGETYVKQGNLEKANDSFRQAIEISPEDEVLAFNVGKIYFAQGNTDKAVEYFLLSIKIKQDWAPAHLQLGYTYLNKGEYKLALESFSRFLELAPDDPQAPSIKNLIPKLEELIRK